MASNPLADLSTEEQEALAELARARVDGRISRRDAIKAAGALGLGGLIGGGAGVAATGNASADPQGNLGTPDDPWENAYIQSVDATSVSAGELVNVADYICGTGDEFLSALSNVSDGETIAVGSVVVDDWLHLDGVTNVTITGYGSSTITIADNAEVGAFRLGDISSVENVTIEGIEIDGNAANQTNDVEYADGVRISDGHNVTVKECYIHDMPEHSDDALTSAGIVSLYPSTDITIEGNRVENNGYRQIVSSAHGVDIERNWCRGGIERHISLDAHRIDNRISQDVTVSKNWCEGGGSIGSNIAVEGLGYDAGFGTAQGTDLENAKIIDNTLLGGDSKRTNIAVRDLTNGADKITVRGNACVNPEGRNMTIGTVESECDCKLTVEQNQCSGPGDGEHNIAVAEFRGAQIKDNHPVGGQNGIFAVTINGTIDGNTIENADNAIRVLQPGNSLTNNTLLQSASNGIRADASDTTVRGNEIVGHGGGDGIIVTEPDCTVRDNVIDSESAGNYAVNLTNNLDGAVVTNNRAKNNSNPWSGTGPVKWDNNTPPFTLDQGTFTLATGGSHDEGFVNGNELNGIPEAIIQPASAGQTSNSWAIDWYFEYRNNDNWRLIVNWEVDPGVDMDFDYWVVPTDRTL